MKKRTVRRVLFFMLIEALICLSVGYVAAPGKRWTYLHLTPGSYVAQFRSLAECRAARNAFAAGRHIPTDAAITIGRDYADLCSKDVGTGGIAL